jgi:hypothetical protein
MPTWREQRDGPRWLMDKDGRVIGVRDNRGNDWHIPMVQSNKDATEATNEPIGSGGGGGGANLSITRDAASVTVVSDSGTDAVIPLADLNAGLLSPTEKTKLAGIETGATADLTSAEVVAAVNAELGGTGWQSGGASDHGALTGLADDDHTQYHNDVRGDARYSALGHGHSNAVAAGAAGFMTGADKSKLDAIEAGATADMTGAEIVAAIDTQLGGATWQGGGGGGGAAVVQEGDTTIVSAAATLDFAAADFDITETPAGEANIAIAAAVARLAGPAFTGTPTAPTAAGGTNTTQLATTAFVQSAVNGIVNAAPGALDTLDELAAALGDDANFATTVTNSLAAKQAINATVEDVAGTTYTLVAGDSGKIKRFTNAAGCTVTVNSGLGAGFNVTLLKASGAGTVTVDGGTAAVNSSSGEVTLTDARALATLVPEAADAYVLAGEVGSITEVVQDIVGAMFVEGGGGYTDNGAGNGTVTFPSSGSATITVQEGDTNVSTAVTTLDFAAADFDVTESPAGEANVAISSAIARLASPALTGTPTAPTAGGGTNTTQLATTAFVTAAVAAAVAGLLDFKGNTNASANPNYPAGVVGDAYVISTAGRVGGASGKVVDVGDVYVCSADNAGGDEATVGTSWFVLEHNLQGALLAANNLSDLASAATAWTNLGGDERAQDAVGAAMVLPSGAYDDATNAIRLPWHMEVAIGDETTAATVGAAKVTVHLPVGVTLTGIYAGCTTAPTGSDAIIDVNDGGTSIMTTNKLRIDAGENSTHTAATPPTLTDTALAKGATLTFDQDQVGSTVAGAGYKVYLVGFITAF